MAALKDVAQTGAFGLAPMLLSRKGDDTPAAPGAMGFGKMAIDQVQRKKPAAPELPGGIKSAPTEGAASLVEDTFG